MLNIPLEKLKTRDQCLAALDKIEAVLADIDAQLGESDALRGKGDVEEALWRVDAKRAKRRLGRMKIAVQNHMAKMPKEKSRTIEGHFIDAAMELLPRETIAIIWKMAHSKMGDRH